MFSLEVLTTRMHSNYRLLTLIATIIFTGCGDDDDDDQEIIIPTDLFKNEIRVRISGYEGDAMEPFISRDDQYLFFNNSGKNAQDMNLHFARRDTDTRFIYIGEIPGTNTTDLEGVPSMDANNNLYFTSLRSFFSNFRSVYSGKFDSESGVSEVGSVDALLSLNTSGIIIFDTEISRDGNTLYYSIGSFSGNNFPDQADLQVASLTNGEFRRKIDSDEIFQTINSDLLQYAPSISNDELEIFYTRAFISDEETQIRVLKAERSSKTEPFGDPEVIQAVIGIQTEGPSISADGLRLYYHQNVDNKFEIWMVSREL